MREDIVNHNAQGQDFSSVAVEAAGVPADRPSDEACLAQEIVEDARSRILMEERYLDSALYALKPVPAEKSVTEDYAADGQHFYFSPEYVLQDFRKEENRICRAYMHALLHSLFLHPFSSSVLTAPFLWDLSCDLAAEGIILSQKKACFRLDKDEEQQKVIRILQDQTGILTAERVFHYLSGNLLTKEKRKEMAALFHSDSHAVWKELFTWILPEHDEKNENRKENQTAFPEDPAQAEPGTLQKRRKASARGDLQFSQFFSSRYFHADSEDQKQIWSRRSGCLLSEMRSGSRGRTEEAGWLMQELSEMKRKPVDFRSALKKFTKNAVSVKPSTEEFNPILYTYGLQLYGDMPLIEESETSMRKKISDFIIAIDTSGSTSGNLVRDFLRQTCGILMDKEMFSEQMNLHILQCDAKIQEICVIRHKSEIDRVIGNMNVRGLGGTDFRPVFTYAQQAVKSGHLQHLQGILYFTDGRGTYPKKRPDCETAFVFMRREPDMPDVPPWAYQMIWEPQT